MKHLLLSSAVALALAGPVLAQTDSLLSAVEAAIAEANADDANISYGSADVGGDGSVTLSGFTMAPDDGEVVIRTDFVKLTPAGDGSADVAVTFADTLTVTATPPDGSEPVEITVANDGFVLTTNALMDDSGDARVSVAANSLEITGGDPAHPMLKALEVRPENLAISFAFDEATRSADASLAVSSLVMDYTIANPEDQSSIRTAVTSEAQSLSFTATGLPEEDGDPMMFLMGGGSFALNIAGGASTTLIDSDSVDLPAKITGTGGPGSAEIAYNADGFVYRVNFGALDYVVEPNPNFMPLPPMQASMSSGLMELVAPVMPGTGPKPVNIGFALRDLVLSDSVWSFIDPGATIPRDPATLEIDIDAVAELTQPIFMLSDAGNPMEVLMLESVDIQRVFLNAGGAEVSADGAVTLDNSGPFPIPSGAIDIAMSGVQGLAQKLVDLGLVDQMQVGMAMGMMMAFGQPGSAPDTFTSKIEFKDGGIFANGQPLQ